MNAFRLVVCVLAWAGSVAVAGEGWAATREPPPAPPPLERPIRVDLWNQPLSEAIVQLGHRGGLSLSVSPAFIAPADLPNHRVYLRLDRVNVRTALDALARALGCRYHVQDGTRVELTTGYDWMRDPPMPVLDPVDRLIHAPEGREELERRLLELAKPLPLLEGRGWFLRVEEQMLGEREKTYKVVGTLPRTMAEYFRFALLETEGHGVNPAYADRPERHEAELAAFEAALRTKVVVNYRNIPAEKVMQELSLQSGLWIALDHDPFRDAPPPAVTLGLGDVTLREALEALGAALGLAGQQMCLPAGVWLTQEPQAWTVARMDREALWEGLQVVGYDARPFTRGLPNPDVLVDRLWRDTAPGLWDDPMAAMTLIRGAGVLIVVAPEWAQREVAAELAGLTDDLAKGLWKE